MRIKQVKPKLLFDDVIAASLVFYVSNAACLCVACSAFAISSAAAAVKREANLKDVFGELRRI